MEDPFVLISKLHGDLLRSLAHEAGQHFQGLHQAGRWFKKELGPLRKKLDNVDLAFNMGRHVTAPLCRQMYNDILACITHGALASPSTSCPSSPRPSECPSPDSAASDGSSVFGCRRDLSPPPLPSRVRNLLLEAEATHFDIFDDDDDNHLTVPVVPSPSLLPTSAAKDDIYTEFDNLLESIRNASDAIEVCFDLNSSEPLALDPHSDSQHEQQADHDLTDASSGGIGTELAEKLIQQLAAFCNGYAYVDSMCAMDDHSSPDVLVTDLVLNLDRDDDDDDQLINQLKEDLGIHVAFDGLFDFFGEIGVIDM